MALRLRRWRPLLSAGRAVSLAVALAGCRQGGADSGPAGPADAPQATIVDIVELRPELLRNVAEIPGQLTAEMTVDLAPEIEGVIESIEFMEGHRVEAGQVLLRLRDQEQRARLREAEAERSLAAAVYRRTRRLAKSNVSSEAQLERAQAELEVARSRVEAAAVELERTLIRAPFGGEMSTSRSRPGTGSPPTTTSSGSTPWIASSSSSPCRRSRWGWSSRESRSRSASLPIRSSASTARSISSRPRWIPRRAGC